MEMSNVGAFFFFADALRDRFIHKITTRTAKCLTSTKCQRQHEVDPPSFSASLTSEDSMHTVVTIVVEHETDVMDVEVRLEGEVEVPSSAA